VDGAAKRSIWIGVAVLLLAVAIAAVRVDWLRGAGLPNQMGSRAAPELVGIEGWVNSAPLRLADLRGKVVLLDFWTYSCVNCVRTFPHLRALYARYHSFGFEIVGVHSPEFDFEKDEGNVRAAVTRHRLPYPVAMDNQMSTWRAYHNQYWPRVYLIDAKGRIRFDHAGEGGEEVIQRTVRALLSEAGAATLPEPLDFARTGPGAGITPEIYAGFERGEVQGSLANPEGYDPDDPVDYAPVSAAAVERAGTEGVFFLEGTWIAERESVRALGAARVVLRFYARDVFFVAAAEGARARVLLDGAPPRGASGSGAPGGIARVGRADLFHALRLPEPGEHTLTLEVPEGFRLYTFTFG
jgi:thiol-disulfide isomerase/thioredoxin